MITMNQDSAKGVSWGVYDALSMNTTGWAQLMVVSSSLYPSDIQYTAAGIFSFLPFF